MGERLRGKMRKSWTESCIMNFRHIAMIWSQDKLSLVCVGLYLGVGQYVGNVLFLLSLSFTSLFLLPLFPPFSLIQSHPPLPLLFLYYSAYSEQNPGSTCFMSELLQRIKQSSYLLSAFLTDPDDHASKSVQRLPLL